MLSAAQEGWTRVWVFAWRKTETVRTFAGHELCVMREGDEFRLFHRRSGWTLASRISETEAVCLAELWSGLDWDFDEQPECPAATRAATVETLKAGA